METSDVIRFIDITDSNYVSARLSDVGVGRGVNCISGWIGITLVLHHADEGATSFGSLCVTFDSESIMGVGEVPSLAM